MLCRLSVNRSDRPRIGLLQSFVPDVVAEQSADPGRQSLVASMHALPGRVGDGYAEGTGGDEVRGLQCRALLDSSDDGLR